MGFKLKECDKLEIVEGSSKYLPCELIVLDGDELDGDKIEKKLHSYQILQNTKIRQDPFELRKINDDFITIRDLSIYKSSNEKISIMNDKLISYRFVVPGFQRGYRWETEQVHELLDDIYINFKKYYDSKSREAVDRYCIQPLVLNQSGDFINEFRVIDGQQRLTTINLMLEALNNQVPEGITFHAYIPISYEFRKKSEEFLYGIGEYCKIAIKNVLENYEPDIPIEKTVENTINYIEQSPTDLDSRYMLNTYLYAYWYFYCVISGKGNGKDYFKFEEINWTKDEQWEWKRFELLAKMLLKSTSVIWYNIDAKKEDEYKVFEDFNFGKIELTSSELIKGIFMNPDNYIDSNNSDDSLYKQHEIRQTILGGQWDEMEKALHNDEFWAFIPHQEDKDHEIDKSTHIDSIFNMYVYFNILEGKVIFNLEDHLFSFKKINELIIKRLKSDSDKFKSMWNLWLDIKNIYTSFYEWFIGDNLLSNKNSLYHRISLFKRIIVDKKLNYEQRYLAELRQMRPLYKNITGCGKKTREKELNLEIRKKLLSKINIQGDIDNFIKTITYNEYPNEVEIILLIFNLSTLERAKGYGGRFPFLAFVDEKWEKEHIFATNTELLGENYEEKELLEALVSENEQNRCDEYFKIVNRSGNQFFKQTVNEINTYLNNPFHDSNKEILRTKLLKKDGAVLEYILRDNHMGNMALLTKNKNIIASNDSYKDKSRKLKKWFKEGNFIPICTMNVFSDFYSSDDGYSTHWLYEKRFSYLNQMIDSVNKYLFV